MPGGEGEPLGLPLRAWGELSGAWLSAAHAAACALLGLEGCGDLGRQLEALFARLAPLTAVLTLLLAVAAAVVLAGRLHAWYAALGSARCVKVASETLEQLRRAQAELHRPTPHMWFRAAGTDLAGPVMCAGCFSGIDAQSAVQVRRRRRRRRGPRPV